MNLPTCISSNRKIRYTVCFVILIILSVLFFIISVCAGSVQIPLSDIWRQFRGEQDELYAAILFQIRIPRTFAAILLGGALALSGYLLQTFFHNPIAGPFVLGISSGAKLFVAVVMIVFLRYSRTLSSVDLIVAAFAGSMLSMFCVLLKRSVRDLIKLIDKSIGKDFLRRAVMLNVFPFDAYNFVRHTLCKIKFMQRHENTNFFLPCHLLQHG
jgi:ABC-type Fe3+-siderophore transport system permease subunit